MSVELRICKVCKIEKTITDFPRYIYKPTGKEFKRKECKSCYHSKYNKPKEFKYCKWCQTTKSIDSFVENGYKCFDCKNTNEVKVDTRKDTFIKKVNRQGGWIDEIDAYRLADIYEDLPYRKNIDNMKIDNQLIYMWEAINNKLEVNIGERKCVTCKEIKPIELFTIEKKRPDGYSSYCKECIREYYREYKRRKKSVLKDNI